MDILTRPDQPQTDITTLASATSLSVSADHDEASDLAAGVWAEFSTGAGEVEVHATQAGQPKKTRMISPDDSRDGVAMWARRLLARGFELHTIRVDAPPAAAPVTAAPAAAAQPCPALKRPQQRAVEVVQQFINESSDPHRPAHYGSPQDRLAYLIARAKLSPEIVWDVWDVLGRDIPGTGITREGLEFEVEKKRADAELLKHETRDGRPKVILKEAVHETYDELDKVLCKAGPTMPIYSKEGHLVAPMINDAGQTRISEISLACLDRPISAVLQFVRERPTKEDPANRVLIAPPPSILANLHARGQWPCFRQLRGVSTTPQVRPDGTIVDRSGYDPQTRTFFDFAGQKFLPVSSHPTAEEVREAREVFVDQQVDFPFADDAARAADTALTLRLLSGAAIDGPTPLFAYTANRARVGKGKRLEANAEAVLGHGAALVPFCADPDETRKKLFAVARSALPLVCVDNWRQTVPVGDPTFDMILTARSVTDRPLGKTAFETAEWTTVLAITGNALTFAADTAPRTLRIMMRSEHEFPEKRPRSDFRHPDQPAYARASRPRVVWATLTILRGFCAAGRPDQGLPSWGSFEAFSDLIRNSLVWAGFADPVGARVPEEQDLTRTFLRDLLSELRRADPAGKGFRAAELVAPRTVDTKPWAVPDILATALPDGATLDRSINLIGKILGGYLDQTCDGHRLARRKSEGHWRWLAAPSRGSGG